MKRVFNSNDQVCHVWAQQKQSEGRAGSIFFSGDTIYSYGTHYPMAMIHTYRGKKFALINSEKSSVTTQHHKYKVRNSLYGLMPVFECSDIKMPSLAIKEMDKAFLDWCAVQKKRNKVRSSDNVKYSLEHCKSLFLEANELRSIMRRKKRPNSFAMR